MSDESARTRSHVARNTRLRQAIVLALAPGLLAAFSAPAVLAAGNNAWDCRVAADGVSWDCSQGGVPEQRVPEQRAPVQAPVRVRPLPPPAPLAPRIEAAPAPLKPLPKAEPKPAPQPAPEVKPKVEAKPQAAPKPVTPPAQSAPAAPAPVAPKPAPAPAPAKRLAPPPQPAPAAPKPEPKPAPEPVAPLRESRIDEGLEWNACATGQADINLLAMAGDYRGQPIDISADGATASQTTEQAEFTGDVELHQGGQSVFADRVLLDRQSGEVEANGDVLLLRPDLRLAAAQTRYNLTSTNGSAQQVEYRLPGIMARGSAAQVEFNGNNSQFNDIRYTTCAPGNQDWQLSAEQLVIDRSSGTATATAANLSLLGVPIMHLPTLTFPVDGKRHSGVLPPTLGYSGNKGAFVAIPYYFNLAPNYDLTLTSQLMSKRGLLLGADFRFLTETTYGEVDVEYLPHDRDNPGNRRRGSLSVNTFSQFSEHVTSEVRFNYASDNDYVGDFGSNLETTSTSHLERAAELRYDTNDWYALLRVQNFQTIDNAVPLVQRPYGRLPQFQFGVDKAIANSVLHYSLDGEVVSFKKAGIGVPEGSRIDLMPGLRAEVRGAYYHLIPSAKVRYTGYKLRNVPGPDTTPERLAAILSVDSGLYFERSTELFGSSVNQTLEPRVHYLKVPQRNHSAIPLFDTNLYDFSYANLFLDNRFNGPDRLGDANQLTLGVTTRFNDQLSGRELLRASLGSIVHFHDRTVQLPGAAPQTDGSSALVGEIAADHGNGWRSRGGLQWDPHNNIIDQALAQASYRRDDKSIVSLAYRLRENIGTHVDLGTVWPISRQLRAIGRWNYSISEQRNLEALAGVEYGSCCWKVRALVQHYTDSNNNDQNLGVLLQLELSGLGSLGDDIESVLSDGIYGYRRDND